MGKVPPNKRQLRVRRQKRWLKNRKSKYLKPVALAQLQNRKFACKLCTDLGKKRVAIPNSKRTVTAGDSDIKSPVKSPGDLSPVRFQLDPSYGSSNAGLQSFPSTPCAEVANSESMLESLPLDLLVKILCHLHHDQLRAVFHVSQKIRKAVIIARQFHFNYTTPDRTRQEMLNTMTPLPTDHWPFMSIRGGKGIWDASPHTPKAPKHGPRPPSRIKFSEMRQIAAVLFQDPSFSSMCLMPSVLRKPVCKTLASNRVLLYEDELCQAVAQNKLR